jgi:hypothetical protein
LRSFQQWQEAPRWHPIPEWFFSLAPQPGHLVEAGEMDLAEAFNGLVQTLSCPCSREMVERWERDHPPVQRRRRRKK